jgi:hypothetical protein
MTDVPLDSTFACRDADSDTDIPFPGGGRWWLVLIDDTPDAFWQHPCRRLFVRDDLGAATETVDMMMPPTVWGGGGLGVEAPFALKDVAANPKPEKTVAPPPPNTPGPEKDCLWAVFISGGWNPHSNAGRYVNNMAECYSRLRRCGFKRGQISVYYAGGAAAEDSLTWPGVKGDLDGDGSSEITDGAFKNSIQNGIASICRRMNRGRDILFIYITDHGHPARSVFDPQWGGAMLWDGGGGRADGTLSPDEVLTPTDLLGWLKDCACRTYILADGCFSGLFVDPVKTSGDQTVAVYSASRRDQESIGRLNASPQMGEYMMRWSDDIPSGMTMDQIQVGGMSSDPQRTDNEAGKHGLCTCCDPVDARSATWGALKAIYR